MHGNPLISSDPGILGGKPVIAGTRIAVELVVELMSRGYSEDQVLAQYPHITRDQVRACLAYASELVKSERVWPLSA